MINCLVEVNEVQMSVARDELSREMLRVESERGKRGREKEEGLDDERRLTKVVVVVGGVVTKSWREREMRGDEAGKRA